MSRSLPYAICSDGFEEHLNLLELPKLFISNNLLITFSLVTHCLYTYIIAAFAMLFQFMLI